VTEKPITIEVTKEEASEIIDALSFQTSAYHRLMQKVIEQVQVAKTKEAKGGTK
jgi:hypothetical protein